MTRTTLMPSSLAARTSIWLKPVERVATSFVPPAARCFSTSAVDGIVYEDADGREARRQRCGTGSEKRVEVDELVPVTGVQLIEQRSLVAFALKIATRIFTPSTANARIKISNAIRSIYSSL